MADATPDVLAVVIAELDRVEALPAVQDRDGQRADSFAVGARWTTRMVREALDRVTSGGAA